LVVKGWNEHSNERDKEMKGPRKKEKKYRHLGNLKEQAPSPRNAGSSEKGKGRGFGCHLGENFFGEGKDIRGKKCPPD